LRIVIEVGVIVVGLQRLAKVFRLFAIQSMNYE